MEFKHWACIILFGSSLLFTLGGLYLMFLHNKCFKNRKISYEKRLLFLTMLFFAAVWCVRYPVGASGIIYENGERLTKCEEIANSVIHALQSFSMDEDFTNYLVKGKELAASLFPKFGAASLLYSIHVSFLNVACPVAGGAILFSILTRIFPKLKLFFMSLMFWKPVCDFSELNDNSLALASSLRVSGGKYKKALIVFSDVYDDSSDEPPSELIQKAKNLGAICIKNDISDMSLLRRGGKLLFLMDRNKEGSLQSLSSVTDEKMCKRWKKDDFIYVVGTDDGDSLVVDSVRDVLKAKLGEDNAPLVIPVNSFRNLVLSLFEEKPLFWAKQKGGANDAENDPLRITIFGSGQIGTEMFLAAYWCGQILDHQLYITVVSKEKETDFRARIDHINPEIFKTAEEGTELLRVYDNALADFAPEYFKCKYVETDIRRDDLYTKMIAKDNTFGRMIDSDYFAVALGADEENIEIADMIARYVTTRKLTEGAKDVGFGVPVACVVFDDTLCETLKKRGKNGGYGDAVEMYPFGSLGETYSYNTVTLAGIRERAAAINDAYHDRISEEMTSEKAIRDLYKDEYSHWANVARAIHIRYKAFCARMTVEEYKENSRYKSNDLNKNHRLAWLEHRRWNAFMRTRGFRCPTPKEEERYIALLRGFEENEDGDNEGKHKSIKLKLHPCIVECDDKYGTWKKEKKDDKKEIDEETESKEKEREPDLLDLVTIRFLSDKYKAKRLKINDDFKKYDYPIGDFDWPKNEPESPPEKKCICPLRLFKRKKNKQPEK